MLLVLQEVLFFISSELPGIVYCHAVDPSLNQPNSREKEGFKGDEREKEPSVLCLGASDYWFRFEWQHRGSPHVHGLTWLPDAPDVEQVLANSEVTSTAAVEALVQYVDKIVSTTNPAVLPDGSNVDEVPPPKTNPHICNLPYSEVEDFDLDLADLIATCQRHTRCSAAY